MLIEHKILFAFEDLKNIEKDLLDQLIFKRIKLDDLNLESSSTEKSDEQYQFV